MAKIRHVVYRAADPQAMADFFVDAFGMTIVHRRPSGAIDLFNGTINLALLPVRSQGQQEMDHIGFMVDDEEEAFR
ncbi:MAG: VOC family protein, partial [Candidatus Methylomirabilis sp.]